MKAKELHRLAQATINEARRIMEESGCNGWSLSSTEGTIAGHGRRFVSLWIYIHRADDVKIVGEGHADLSEWDDDNELHAYNFIQRCKDLAAQAAEMQKYVPRTASATVPA